MNKAELIEGLTARLGDKKVATHALEGFIDIIERAVAKGEKVSITGFGTFEKVDRPARKARNPLTGESIKVKKTSVPKFRPGSALKQVANGTTKKGREPKHEPLLPQGVTRLVSQPTAATTSGTAAKTATTKPAATKSTARKSTASKSTADKKAPAKKVAAKTTATTRATATKAATKAPAKSAATKTAATKTAATKSAPAKKTATKSAPAKKTAAKTTASKATATKATAKKAPARKASTRKVAAK